MKSTWKKRELKQLGKKPDTALAAKFGRSPSTIRAKRKELGIKAFSISNSSLANPDPWFVDWACGAPASSGERVSERTAMGLSAYLACIKNISEDEAKLPFCVYKKLDPRGRQPLPNHPVHTLIHDAPNYEMSAMTFRQTLTCHALGWHGGFAEIVRDGSGMPVELWPLDPTCVQVMREFGGERRLYYQYTGLDGKPTFFWPADILHIHGLGYNGVTGYVLAQLAKDPIGNALAAQKFSGSFFANGTTTTGVIEVPGPMSDAAFKHLRESFAQRYGGAGNQHKPVILEEDAKWSPTSTEPQKSQMIETLQMGVEEVARLFRMPPHKIGHLLRATFSNIEQQAIEYVQDTLLGWCVRWEQEVWRKLFMPRERRSLFAKHNVNMLMRGDSTQRGAFYQVMSNIGAFGPNDVRELEDMNPVEGGDAHFVNAAMVPLDMAAEGEHLAMNQSAPAADPASAADDTSYNASALEHKRELIGRVAAAHQKPLEEIIASILRVEFDKVRRASKREDFGNWAVNFYQNDHKQHVLERITPALAALGTSLEAAVWN